MLSILASILFTVSFAECASIGEQALKTCRSEQALSGAQQDAQDIFGKFKPNNNRMSPESCQGFKDSYNNYRDLTNSYIQNCKSMIDQVDECIVSIFDKPKGPSTLEDLRKATDLQGRAVAELPKLMHLKAPMPKMKSLLEDCLRETQGQRIQNTNTDRGDANTNGSPTANKGSAGADGSGQGGSGSSAGNGSGGGSSGGGEGLGGSPSSASKAAQNSSATQDRKAMVTNGSTQQAAGAAVLNPSGGGAPIVRGDSPAGSAAPHGKASSLARLVEHQRVMKRLGQRRPASSLEAEGITGPHSNMFFNIKGRYLDIRSRGDLL